MDYCRRPDDGDLEGSTESWRISSHLGVPDHFRNCLRRRRAATYGAIAARDPITAHSVHDRTLHEPAPPPPTRPSVKLCSSSLISLLLLDVSYRSYPSLTLLLASTWSSCSSGLPKTHFSLCFLDVLTSSASLPT